MGERKAWSKEEDAALIEIIEIQKIKKWSTVSRSMQNQFKIIGRTGKQCRERWHNQLDPKIKTSEWTSQQEKILFKLHGEFGNRWAKISQELEGRTDNCVKNHFYSTLRRGFRKLNKYVTDNRHIEGLKQLKPVMLSKLVAAAQDKYDKKLKLSDETIQKSIELKNRLIPLSQEDDTLEIDQREIEDLIRQTILFCRSYKRKKGKKVRKVNEDYGEPYFEKARDVSINSLDDNKEQFKLYSPNTLTPLKHINLFNMSKVQIYQSEPISPVLKTKDSFISSSLQHRPLSKIQQEYIYQSFYRKESNRSNFDMFKIPSMQEKASNISLSNQFHMQTLGFGRYVLESSFNLQHKNLFGIEISNTNQNM